jgi:hypothetical protein
MNQRFVLIFAVFSIFSLLFHQEYEGLSGLKSIAKGVATNVRSSVAKSSIIGAKKALLLAPVVVPLAIGKAIYFFLQLKI